MVFELTVMDENLQVLLSHHYRGPVVSSQQWQEILKQIREAQDRNLLFPLVIQDPNLTMFIEEPRGFFFMLTTDEKTSLDDAYLTLERVRRLLEQHREIITGDKGGGTKDLYGLISEDLDKIFNDIYNICITGQLEAENRNLFRLVTGYDPKGITEPSTGIEILKTEQLVANSFTFSLMPFINNEAFLTMMDFHLKNSNLTLLLSNGSPENVRDTKAVYDLMKTSYPGLKVVIIVDKKDQGKAWPPKMIERVIGAPTFEISSSQNNARARVMSIINENLKKTS